MTAETVLESVLRRDRLIVTVALVAVMLAAWAYVLAGAGTGMSPTAMSSIQSESMLEAAPSAMDGNRPAVGDGPSGMAAMPGMAPTGEGSGKGSLAAMPKEALAARDIPIADMGMMTPAAWTPGYAVLMFFMWWAMMVAMMLPSAAPMILLFATVNRKQRARAAPFVPTGIFAGAYLVTWGGFSLVAVGLQWTLQQLTGLSPAMASTSSVLGGLLLLAAGLYQLTPIKQACLRHCRHPTTFLASHWRRGIAGAVRMGLEHGAYCVGCCWFLMGLLFVGGVMNLKWIAGLALLVLLEKTIPAGHWLGYATGVTLAGWGLIVLAGGA
jgi:predicted metal-binding membrane protein